MNMNDDFQAAVLSAICDREAKILVIMSGIENFLDRAIDKVNPADNRSDTYEKRDIGFDEDAYKGVIYQSFRNGEDSNTLQISVSTSGKVSVSFDGVEFGYIKEQEIAAAVAHINGTEEKFGHGETHKFDFDSYTSAEAVAKILTIIQDVDLDDFGPLVSDAIAALKGHPTPPPPRLER